jgi:hypothetical protein
VAYVRMHEVCVAWRVLCVVRVNALLHSCARRLGVCALGVTLPTPTPLLLAASTGLTLHSIPHIQSHKTHPHNFPITNPLPLYILKMAIPFALFKQHELLIAAFCKSGVHRQANWCIFRSLAHSNQIASLL